jgi:hypothetical protein
VVVRNSIEVRSIRSGERRIAVSGVSHYTGDYIGKPCCYCERSKQNICTSCIGPKGLMKRVYRNHKIETSIATGGWSPEERMLYTTVTRRAKRRPRCHRFMKSKYIPRSLSITLRSNWGNTVSTLLNSADKEQDRNFLPDAITVDMNFSQNFVYTDRMHAIQSDHWKSSSTTLFVGVLRYVRMLCWNRPPAGLKKGQSVSIINETSDGGGDVYVYGEVDVDQDTDEGARACLEDTDVAYL